MSQALSPSFFSVDLILTEDNEVKILEFNRGVDSGFYGYEHLTTFDLWHDALVMLHEHYGIPADRFFYDQIDDGLARLPEILQPISALDDDGDGAIIFPAGGSDIGYLRRMYPQAVIVDGSLPMHAAFKNKAIFEVLFRRHMPNLLPYGQVVSSAGDDVDAAFMQRIARFGKGVVIKAPVGIQGDGVHMFEDNKASLMASFVSLTYGFNIMAGATQDGALPLLPQDAQAFDAENEVRVVQALHPSKTIDIDGQNYRSCIRLAIMMLPDTQFHYKFHLLGAYHKPAMKPVGSKAEAQYKSQVSTPNGVRAKLVERADRVLIEEQLVRKGFGRAVSHVLRMDAVDMALRLLKPRNRREIGAAHYVLFSRDFMDETAITRVQAQSLRAALESAMDDYPQFARQVYLRLIKGDDALMPEIFKGVVQRKFYAEVGWSCWGRDALTQVNLTTHNDERVWSAAAQRYYEKPSYKAGMGAKRPDNHTVLPPHKEAFVKRAKSLTRGFVILGDAKFVFDPQPFTAPFYCGVQGCIKVEPAKTPAEYAARVKGVLQP